MIKTEKIDELYLYLSNILDQDGWTIKYWKKTIELKHKDLIFDLRLHRYSWELYIDCIQVNFGWLRNLILMRKVNKNIKNYNFSIERQRNKWKLEELHSKLKYE